ncbi:beta-galactosidase [Paenilisteria newyorkensis]|uniref:beta-galactosidase n=1 Tax=Listeria newyorkensis TaxID=1497681 RepID=UPI000B0D97B4|nr:beta-galactosidase [Listeria newyorkensis]
MGKGERMIELVERQIRIDGKAVLVMCGEIHYFRLAREDWEDRIVKLKEAGCNAVASYIPWICHEPVRGQVDLTGTTRAELDLGAFIDLCASHALYFFARPGPFIMAEMKNEGIPYWVYDEIPEAIPVGWDAVEPTTPTLDYLAPRFLSAAENWYREALAVIAPRTYPNGGNVMALQLDNEIGMLSWVSNTPDLTDNVLADFASWLDGKTEHGYPFETADIAKNPALIRSPKEDYSAKLHQDLGYYMRDRFRRYVETLRNYAENFGVTGIPFVVNIHGTGGGRGYTFPIGISQLYESYTHEAGYLPGSDIYFGDFTMENFHDLHLINAFMTATNRDGQPITSVEFNCGDGNFGDNLGGRYDVSAADLKARLCVAQGNRLINYYLMAGGYNYEMAENRQDGNNRIAITGERHGFAAPISPGGELNYTYPRMAESIQTIIALGDKLAAMDEEHDALHFAFIPDYYMTEYSYPSSAAAQAIKQNIEANRASGSWDIVAKSLLLNSYRFGAIDIQNREFDAQQHPVIALPCARYLARDIQERLVTYLETGGALFIYGELPLYDMEGAPCKILTEALGATYQETKNDHGYSLSITGENWCREKPEIRTHHAQLFSLEKGTAILKEKQGDGICGIETKVGKGHAIAITTAYRGDIDFIQTAFTRLGAPPMLAHDYPHHGIVTTTTKNAQNERFVHLLNLDGMEKQFRLTEQDAPLFGGNPITLGAKSGLILPLQMQLGPTFIEYSTAEVMSYNEQEIRLRVLQPEATICIQTTQHIRESRNYTITKKLGSTILHIKTRGKLKIQFDK